MTGAKIKSLRLEARLTIVELAKLAELDRSTVSSAEKGRNVSELSLAKIKSALEILLKRRLNADG